MPGDRDFEKGEFIRLMPFPAILPAALPYSTRRLSTTPPSYPLHFTVIAAPLPSFPRKRESRTAMPYNAASPASNSGIPAYAGRTVGRRE